MEDRIVIEVSTDPTMFWIAIATGVFALISALFVVREYLRERVRFPEVMWDVNAWGTAETHLNRPGVAVRISNSGVGTAILMSIVTFKCIPVVNAEPKIKSWHFPAASSADMLFLAEDVRTAWVLLTWREHADFREVRQAWFPLMKDTPLEDQWLDSRQRSKRPKWQRWWLPKEQTRAIGPGVHQLRILRKRKLLMQGTPKAEDAALKSVLGIPESILSPSGGQSPWDYVARSPSDIRVLQEQMRYPRPEDQLPDPQ